MVKIYGSDTRAITGGTGIEVPLEPRAVTAEQAEQRRQRQIAAIEAAASAARAAKPAPRARRRGDLLSLPAPAPRPAPTPKPAAPVAPAVLIEPRESGMADSDLTPEATPEPGLTPELVVESESELVLGPTAPPGSDADAEPLIRRLRTELAMAGTRISDLLAQVEDQTARIARAEADLQTVSALLRQLSHLATEQQDVLRARAETAERDLAAAHQLITSLIAERTASAAPSAHVHDEHQVDVVVPAPPAGKPVRCLGAGCGLPVNPEYVARTGNHWHGPCADTVPATARLAGRRAA